ncbi:hypothetical protein M9H77_09214 [Catharanthus roseus]|uniref:Uncharacterized protein n=1 Tax=Catharanthus roseus TaxID=4058 RepID=A0ACC0C070_CATRO|nr:hypothetical protein M9H77_09214 [Catharanthus roseus]
MTMENEVQSSPSNFFNLIDDNCDVDPSSMLIEMYNENSKLICENKSILESLEVLKKEKECSNNDFQKLVLENKNLCEMVSSLEKCLIDYESLKKKEKKILKNFLVHKDILMINMALDTTTLMLLQSKHILLKLLHPSPIFVVLVLVRVVIRPLGVFWDSIKIVKTKNANVGREGHGETGGSSRDGKKGKGKQLAWSETPLDKFISFYATLQRGRTQSAENAVTSRVNGKNIAFDDKLLNSILKTPEDGMCFYTKNKKCFDPNLYSEKRLEEIFIKGIIVEINNRVIRLERGGKDTDEDEDD